MIKLYSTENPNKAEIIKQMLEENDINVVLLNKQDSSYMNFGEAELKVLESDSEKALQIINQENE